MKYIREVSGIKYRIENYVMIRLECKVEDKVVERSEDTLLWVWKIIIFSRISLLD